MKYAALFISLVFGFNVVEGASLEEQNSKMGCDQARRVQLLGKVILSDNIYVNPTEVNGRIIHDSVLTYSRKVYELPNGSHEMHSP